MSVSLQRVKWYIWFLVYYVVRNPLKKKDASFIREGRDKKIVSRTSLAFVLWSIFSKRNSYRSK